MARWIGHCSLLHICGLHSIAIPANSHLPLTGSLCNSGVNEERDKCFSRAVFPPFQWLMANSNKNTRIKVHFLGMVSFEMTPFGFKNIHG